MKNLLLIILTLCSFGVSAQISTLTTDWIINSDSTYKRSVHIGADTAIADFSVYGKGTTLDMQSLSGVTTFRLSSNDSANASINTLYSIAMLGEADLFITSSTGTSKAAIVTSTVPANAAMGLSALKNNIGVFFKLDATSGAFFTDTRANKQGIVYTGSDYVKQPGSLTDKRYVDKNIMLQVFKASLPAPSLGQIVFVVDATGGACPAWSDGAHWKRFNDNSIIN